MLSLNISPESEVSRITSFIKAVLINSRKKSICIALSGGVDSAVSFCLVRRVVSENNIYVLRLPYSNLNQKGIANSDLLLKKFNFPEKNIIDIDITDSVNNIAKISKSSISNIRTGNIMARVRMIYLFDYANKTESLVCGTENRSEHLLGYFTRFGDEASDIEPIVHLYKTQVYQLANYLEIPREIIEASPTAGLWKDQTDERQLGFSYKEADKVLSVMSEYKFNKSQYESKLKDFKNSDKISSMVNSNSFKQLVPYNIDTKD